MRGALMLRADALAGCTEGSEEDIELQAIVDLIEACEALAAGQDSNVPVGTG
jgi:hypothetical protein